MSEEIPTDPAVNPLAVAWNSLKLSNPYVLILTVLLGSGGVTFGVQQATNAEVAALSLKVDDAVAACSAVLGAVDAYHKSSDDDGEETDDAVESEESDQEMVVSEDDG